MADRLIHDAAFAGATYLTEIAGPAEDADKKEFHRKAYEVIKASIEGYNLQRGEQAIRLAPSRN